MVTRALLRVAKIKDLGIAVVLIHHSGHAADRLRGASAMYGAVCGADPAPRDSRRDGSEIRT